MATNKPAKKRVNPKLVSTITLAVLLVLTVILSVIGLGGMKISSDGLYKLLPWMPGVNNEWKEALVPGNDLGGGTYIDFSAQQDDLSADAYQTALKDAMDVLYSRLSYKGYSSAQVTLTEDNIISVELPAHDSEALLESLVTAKGDVKLVDGNNAVVLEGSQIAIAQPYSEDNKTFSLSVMTTEEGKQLLADATAAMAAAGSGSMSLVVDGATVVTATVNTAFTDGGVVVPVGDDLQAVWNYAALINFGELPIALEQSASGSMADKALGNAADGMVLAMYAALFIFMLYMIIRYRLGGLLGAWTLWMAFLFTCMFAALAKMTFAVSTAIAVMASSALTAGAIIMVLDAAGAAVKRGQLAQQALHTGFKASNAVVLDAHFMLILAGFALMAVGMGTVHLFSRVFTIGALVSIVCVVIFLRVIAYNCAIILPGSGALYTGKKEIKEAQ